MRVDATGNCGTEAKELHGGYDPGFPRLSSKVTTVKARCQSLARSRARREGHAVSSEAVEVRHASFVDMRQSLLRARLAADREAPSGEVLHAQEAA